ncbi:hypothetical protein F4801DRAFT_572345 [Xylaria longipes]|nr:hypothetical protein F4801DRAFT_572345 [Xylaria longipes]
MFQWYKSAAVCYAYLYDVSGDIESNIAESRWITRGWTLQELIAPREVVFYSSDWNALGTRSELSVHLETATRIDKQFLMGGSLDKASIAQRMSWAAMRSTSREEDEAYCLLGIFDINMPLIYGEGSKAFRRLQEVLVREYPEDHSLFAWGKVVTRLPNQFDNYGELFGLKPLDIRHNPNEVEKECFGLLAKCPRDFQHSGQLVRAPKARDYFRPELNTVSTLAGDTAFVNLPGVRGVVIVRHSKRLPIVQLLQTGFIILLCGQWDDLRTNFRYAAVPFLLDGRSCRFEEIIISDPYTPLTYSAWDLNQKTSRIAFGPMLPLPRRNGDMLTRRNASHLANSYVIGSEVDDFPSHGLIRIPGWKQGAFQSITYQAGKEYGLMITIIRLEALDHSTQARNRGRLSFSIQPFAITGQGTREFTVLKEHGDSKVSVGKEKLYLKSFPGFEESKYYGLRNWRDMVYGHDMAIPRDEWSFSVIGLADVYISVERMFFAESDSDDNPENDESHSFMDVLDIIVNKNTNEDNAIEENEVKQDKVERVEDKEEVDTGAIDEANAYEDGTRDGKREAGEARMNILRDLKRKMKQSVRTVHTIQSNRR